MEKEQAVEEIEPQSVEERQLEVLEKILLRKKPVQIDFDKIEDTVYWSKEYNDKVCEEHIRRIENQKGKLYKKPISKKSRKHFFNALALTTMAISLGYLLYHYLN